MDKKLTDWKDRIVADPKILLGKPVVRGTRISVEHILDLLANGWGMEDVLNNYPGVTMDDIRACLAYAKEVKDPSVCANDYQ